jgi:hypothetical protein
MPRISKYNINKEECDCCDPPVVFKNKNARYYHYNNRPEIKMKKARVEDARNKVAVHLPAYKSAVIADAYRTTKLQEFMNFTEGDLDETQKADVREFCLEELKRLKTVEKPLKMKTDEYFETLTTDEERAFFRDLKTKVRVEHTGERFFAHPTDSLKDLKQKLLGKIDAIDYELLRREHLPEQIVLEFIAERYEPVGYTDQQSQHIRDEYDVDDATNA